MQNLISVVYPSIFFLYALTLILKFSRLKNIANFFFVAALIINAAALVLIIISSGHWPFFGLFESFLLTAFILGMLLFFSIVYGKGFIQDISDVKTDTGTWVLVEILFLLFVTLFFPKTASPSVYDHDNIYILLFFSFRIISLGTILFSSAQFIQFRQEPQKGKHKNRLLQQGRNFLLLGTLLFLISEYAGIIWCQNGWGDFWHWSTGFFQSTLILFYFMIFFHIPPDNNKKSEGIRSVIGSMGGLFMAVCIILRHI